MNAKVQELPIFTEYNVQRFTQVGSMDCANWYQVQAQNTKSNNAMYPAMGRKHLTAFGENRLIYSSQPEFIFKTINYMYVFINSQVFQVDRFLNQVQIGNYNLGGEIWFDWLAVNDVIYAMFTDEQNVYVITEDVNTTTFGVVTDDNAPDNPYFVVVFGDRFTVSDKNTPNMHLTPINLGVTPNDLDTIFTIENAPLIIRASNIIRQMCTLHAQLYVFTDFTTDIYANIQQQISANEIFPWKRNSSYNWDYGMANRLSLSVDYGRMCWLAKNANGLVSFMVSDGGAPVDISTQAINVILENSREDEGLSPFITDDVNGFLYQYENSVFYRVSAGTYDADKVLDNDNLAYSLEFNFDSKKWARCIELNGERNRIEKHVYFADKHLVTAQSDTAIYQMAGNIYRNEIRRPDTAPQASDAFIKLPFRYLLTTQQIYMPDYAEFITEYVQIDFVFGHKTFFKNNAPFDNTVFIIDEDGTPSGAPIYLVDEDSAEGDEIFLIMEEGNTPSFDDNHYYALFKPHIELYISDDGGITFYSVDLREFSPLGAYQWRMRWYELGTSRNRVYKLVCVSSAPIVILGATQKVRKASGGAD